jgi:uncharacterized membrane protein
MTSQNRQEARDRLRSIHDYRVNLKAELEIRQLHQKIDHLLSHQWDVSWRSRRFRWSSSTR